MIAAATLLSLPVQAVSGSPEVEVVERLHQMLARNMRTDGERNQALRAERLAPVVAAAFDFDAISRAALGGTFDTLDGDARDRFRALMQRLSTLTYAERFAPSDGGQRFVTVEQRQARRGRILIRTRLERNDGTPVQLDYVLHGTPADPRIINVLADGVSDLALKRAEYSAVIRRQGIDALFRRMAEQVQELEDDPRSGS